MQGDPREVMSALVLGFGSNLGDRRRHIELAIRGVALWPGLSVLATAPLYQTPPFGGPEQGPYLNSAAVVRTRLSAREVLSCALSVERSLGRVRPDPVRWGPRTIDIDLLWIEGLTIDDADLVVPHPWLRERAFALRPLLDLVPDARDPRTGEPYATLPAALAPIEVWGDPPHVDRA